MVISAQPVVLELELESNGDWTNEISDTYRPTARNEVGHADTSLYGYLDALEGSYEHFKTKAGEIDFDEYFVKNVYHVPFGGMTFRAHKALLRTWKRMKTSEAKRHWEAKSRRSLVYNSLFGGSYTSATFLALMGLIDESPELKAGDRISMFSYGSGSCAEFYTARIGEKAHEVVAAAKLREKLARRERVSVADYEAIETARTKLIDQPTYEVDQSGLGDLYERRYAGQGLLVLDGIDEWERKYRLS